MDRHDTLRLFECQHNFATLIFATPAQTGMSGSSQILPLHLRVFD
jgi:hypothetical protein